MARYFLYMAIDLLLNFDDNIITMITPFQYYFIYLAIGKVIKVDAAVLYLG